MPLLPWRRPKGGKSPFSTADVSEFTTCMERGNFMSAFKYGVKILSDGLNGPPIGLHKNTTTEFDFGETEKKQLEEYGDRLQAVIDGNELRLGEAAAKRAAEPKKEAAKPAPKGKGKDKEEAHADDTTHADDPDNVVTRSGEPGVGAVPWALIVQIALAVLKMIQDWKSGQ